jgi:quercetin dioxygenase-like cupin family protein
MKRVTLTLELLLTFSLETQRSRAHDDHYAEKLGVKIEKLADSTRQWDGSILPNYPTGQPQIKVLRIKIPAGVTLPWHYHPVINAAVILDGTLELKSENGMRQQYERGDALFEVVNKLHSGKAIGPKDVHLVVFYAGEKGEPTTLLKE